MDDGNNGGQRYISIKGMKTNLLSSKALDRFILMGLTTANHDTKIMNMHIKRQEFECH